eukprot:2008393-Rhodomonas_salina.2
MHTSVPRVPDRVPTRVHAQDIHLSTCMSTAPRAPPYALFGTCAENNAFLVQNVRNLRRIAFDLGGASTYEVAAVNFAELLHLSERRREALFTAESHSVVLAS